MGRAVLAVFVVAAAARVSVAGPIRLDLSGGACDLDGLEAQLFALAGTDPVDAAATATVRVEVARAGHAFEAQVFFDDGDGATRGPRSVTAKTCADLVKSVALVIAMALPEAPSDPAPPHVISTPVTEVFAREEMVVASREPTRASTPVRVDVIAAGGVTTHGLAGQVRLGARVRRGAVSLDAEVRADVAQPVPVAEMARIDVARAQLSLGPCVHLGAFAGCVIASAGAFHGSGEGLVASRRVYSPVLAGGTLVTWEHAITQRVAVRLHIDLDALLTTTVFDVDDMQVWVSPRVEGSAGIGVLAHFP